MVHADVPVVSVLYQPTAHVEQAGAAAALYEPAAHAVQASEVCAPASEPYAPLAQAAQDDEAAAALYRPDAHTEH